MSPSDRGSPGRRHATCCISCSQARASFVLDIYLAARRALHSCHQLYTRGVSSRYTSLFPCGMRARVRERSLRRLQMCSYSCTRVRATVHAAAAAVASSSSHLYDLAACTRRWQSFVQVNGNASPPKEITRTRRGIVMGNDVYPTGATVTISIGVFAPRRFRRYYTYTSAAAATIACQLLAEMILSRKARTGKAIHRKDKYTSLSE
uniref:Uncharacterized protein n=1 Tax=Trichogramma kaykai TaxID=54128 RepID=A0ABD2VSL5_9HYME